MRSLSRKQTTVVGVACAALCVVCVLLYVGEVRGEAEEARAEALARYGGEQVEVCVAARDIAAGETVDASAVKSMLWVADLLPEGAISAADEVVGKRATSSILKGEAISSKRFESKASSFDVPEGMSAVSVPAKDVQAVGGAVSPGMRVNIYATGSSSTSLLARDVQVLATSASASGEDGDAEVTWITVAVEPSGVEELVAAAQSTKLYFALPSEQEGAASSAAAGTAADTTGAVANAAGATSAVAGAASASASPSASGASGSKTGSSE